MNTTTIYTVVLNYNGWQDTIACLEAVFASTGVNIKVIVCDNASSDNSISHLQQWAEGKINAVPENHPRLAHLTNNSLHPIATQTLSKQQSQLLDSIPATSLTIIDNGSNLGFAAGNNVGLRYALAQQDMDYVWLLNNDTLVEPDCAWQMLRKVQQHSKPAICGSIIHFFDRPEIIQAIGGNRFNIVTGNAKQANGRNLPEHKIHRLPAKKKAVDYISGCSMLMPKSLFQRIGFLSEDFFLYYEEIDLFTRIDGQFDILVADKAHLYHREGSSIGSGSRKRAASAFSDYHCFKSRLTFMRKYYPYFLLFFYLASYKEVLKRFVKGQIRNAQAVLTVLHGRNPEFRLG